MKKKSTIKIVFFASIIGIFSCGKSEVTINCDPLQSAKCAEFKKDNGEDVGALAALSSSFGSLNPVFETETFNYTITVPNRLKTLIVTPTTEKSGSSVQIKVNTGSYVPVESGKSSSALALSDGDNTLSILVTSKDGVMKRTYTITVNREPPVIYVMGNCMDGSGKYIPGYWKDGVWNGLTTGYLATGIAVSDDNVYVSGYTSSGAAGGGYWKNGTWKELNLAEQSTRLRVGEITVSGSDVFVSASRYLSAGWTAGYWKNDEWIAIERPDAATASYATSITLSDNKVYIAGSYDGANGGIPTIWTGTTKTTEAPPLVSGKLAIINSLYVSGGAVYAAGYAVNKSSIRTPGYWKDGVWTALTPLDTRRDAEVSSFMIAENVVYAAGYSGNEAGKNIPGYWKDGVFQQLTVPSSKATFAGATSIISMNGKIYTGGFYQEASTVSTGYWLDGSWNGLPSLDAVRGCGSGPYTQVKMVVY
jgi:hypothetical protein